MHLYSLLILLLCLMNPGTGRAATDSELVTVFAQARVLAAEIVATLESSDELVFPASQIAAEKQKVRDFFDEHRTALIEDIQSSQHLWQQKDGPCATTTCQRNANIIFSISRCKKESLTYISAARFLIGESVHHFNFGDAFTDWMKEAVIEGFRHAAPERYEKFNVLTSLPSDLVENVKKQNLFGRIGSRADDNMYLGISRNGKIIMSTQPGGYTEGSGQRSGIFTLNLEQSKIMGSVENKNRNFGCNSPVKKIGNKFVGECDMFFGGSIQRFEPAVQRMLIVDHYNICKFTYVVEIEPLYDNNAINVVIKKPVWLDARSKYHYSDPRNTCRQSQETILEAAWFALSFE